MKKLLLLKMMLLLCALITGSGTAWADSYTITFATGTGDGTTASTSTACSDVVSAGATYLSGNLATATKVYYAGSNGLKLGASSSAGTIKMNLASNVTPTSIVVNAKLYNSSKAATLKVNGSTAQSITSKSEISYIQLDASKYCWIKSITVNYAAASSAEATTTTIDATGITNTNKYVSTAAGSLSASVTETESGDAVAGSTVTWSGDNDAVATIDEETGEVTLVGAGTVTFTATYDGVEDEYSSSSDTYEMTVTNEDPDIVTIWSENFSTYSADDVPDGGTYSYACVDGTSNTKIYAANLAGGTSPELLVGKGGGSFTATIPLLFPTYGYSGNLTLTFKTNNTNIAVSTSTDGVTVTGSIVSGTNTITLSGVTTSMENVVITFTNSTSSNVRLDDIVLKGKQAELSVVATPSISPASGAVASGTEVTMTCATDGATIYYTTDNSTPTSSSKAYNPASKPTITADTTIKAIAVKAGLTDSEVASASYTIAAPCATPTFSVAEGEVDKGATVTINCDTDDATIYYTTNGETPTTSSSVYSSALTINTAQTIKAIAAKEGYANSEVASATYTVRDYATLPFNWAGGTTASLTAVTGVTADGLGSDYAVANAPYYIKMDGVGDYIQIKTNAQPGKVYVDVKMVGGSNTSKIKIQESADGSSFTDVEEFTISGSQNDIVNIVSLEAFASASRYVRIIKSEHGSNIGVGPITITQCVPVTISAAEYATYCNSTNALDFTGKATVYTVTDKGTYAKLNEIASGQVPANTPVLLYKAGGGTVNVPVITSAYAVGDNDLHVSTGEKPSDAYVLAKPAGYEIGFYLWDSSKTLNEGKIYLKATGAGARSFLSFNAEGETTGIESIDNGQLIMDNGAVYDLQGRKVQNPKHGLYIINGKKVIIK